jgi:hypothetical protein
MEMGGNKNADETFRGSLMNNNKHGYGMVLDATEKYNIRQQKKF